MKFFIFVLIFIISCSTNDSVKNGSTEFNNSSILQSIHEDSLFVYKNDTLTKKIERINILHQEALQYLTSTDTVNADLSLDLAITLMQNFSVNELDELEDDANYISLSKNIYDLHSSISDDDFSDHDAEDLRSDVIFTTDEDSVGLLANLNLVTDDIEMQPLNLNIDSVLIDIDSTKFTIPVNYHSKVKATIKYFTGKGRKVFNILLERSTKYRKLIEKILAEEGVPKDLFYLAMIESGFNPNAKSWASAVGPWQFIKPTGRAYGLKASYWADDRRDVENSTHAAARHLKDLYERFGDWYLAMAGYNCNPNKITRAVKLQKTTKYFDLKRIPRETRAYVPNFLAAMIIGQAPEKFGFSFIKHEPIEYDRIYIKESIDLNHIAKASNTPYERIRELNPAIIKWVTPSDRDSMYINVPIGTSQLVLNYIDSLPDDQKQKYVQYTVKSGDVIGVLARKFNIDLQILKTINKLSSNLLRRGQILIAPVPDNIAAEYTRTQEAEEKKAASKRTKARRIRDFEDEDPINYNKLIYVVKAGDNIGQIAELFQIRAQQIRNWNGLYGSSIRVGENLIIWQSKYPKKVTSSNTNKTINTQIPIKKEKELDSKFSYHKVSSGDTYWSISLKYNVSIAELKKLNKTKKNKLKIGDTLIIGKNNG